MRRTLVLLAASAALAVPLALRAQSRPATLAGLRFRVPVRFTAMPALNDSATAVFADAERGDWAFAALLPRVEDRPALVRRLAVGLVGAVLGVEAGGVEWQMAIQVPADSAERFHRRLMAVSGERVVDFSVHQFRAAGRDVLVGSASLRSRDAAALQICGSGSGMGLGEGAESIVASLLGRAAPVASGFRELAPGASPRQGGRPDAQRQKILDTYAAYTRAVRARDTAAVGQIAPAVLAFYDDLRTLALHAAPAEVHKLPLLERMQVLMLRHRVDAARLRSMSPAGVFAAMEVENGHFDPSITPGELVAGSGPGVSWTILRQGSRDMFLQMGFVRSGGVWRVDMLPTIAGTECLFRASLRRNGVTREQEDEILLRTLQTSTGRAPSPDIWQPLIRAAATP